jgi:4-diphosphocytidyl-2-C-methyl-D-erythritol kinase
MIIFAPAKINLGLNVLFKRPDGYHELDTCMLPVPLYDVLELLKSEKFEFYQTGIVVPGSSEDNLCIKAYQLLKNEFDLPPVYMHLRKEIPMGAGLGGGSSDASHVLKGLNELFELGLSIQELEDRSAKLGSDCPVFIQNKAQIAQGRGEVLKPCKVDLSGYWIKLIHPGIHVGTKEAYAGIVFSDNNKSVQTIVEGPIEEWKSGLKNDFETSVFALHPALAKVKTDLYQEGAVFAAMSGSGSTVFGIFRDEPQSTNLTAGYSEFIRKF